MSEEITGGCLCGEIRYKATLSETKGVYCHCKDCQKASGGAFTFNMPVKPQNFTLVSGKTKTYEKIADSGRKVVRNFCPNCSSMIFAGDFNSSPFVWIQAGTLDNPDIVKPKFQIWTKSRVSWSNIEPDLLAHETNPH